MPETLQPQDPTDDNLLLPADADRIDPMEGVEIRETRLGHGLFASRDFPAEAVVGEIEGELVEGEDYGSDYAMEFDDGLTLEPGPPFRFLNHSCSPNCEYVWCDDEGVEDLREARHLYVVTLREVRAGEELTIDYAWPAESAIRCLCGAHNCRGWVVCETELSELLKTSEEEKSNPAA